MAMNLQDWPIDSWHEPAGSELHIDTEIVAAALSGAEAVLELQRPRRAGLAGAANQSCGKHCKHYQGLPGERERERALTLLSIFVQNTSSTFLPLLHTPSNSIIHVV